MVSLPHPVPLVLPIVPVVPGAMLVFSLVPVIVTYHIFSAVVTIPHPRLLHMLTHTSCSLHVPYQPIDHTLYTSGPEMLPEIKLKTQEMNTKENTLGLNDKEQ